jgi:succinate dehydrogenase / fumarate reductase iron-sulfur subunit
MPESTLTLRVWRTARPGRQHAGFDEIEVRVDRDVDSVLDVIERAWAEADQTLVFRHACHHASCGTCAVRVDGRERLPCVTPLRTVWDGRAPLTIEPLRNLPPVADLAIDPTDHLVRMARLQFPYVRGVEGDARCATRVSSDDGIDLAERFEDCLECLACVSACPVASGDPDYLGPAALAAAQRIAEEPRHAPVDLVLDLADGPHGVWQCRSVWACSAVCPSGNDPASRIMDLRRRLLVRGQRAGVAVRSVAS